MTLDLDHHLLQAVDDLFSALLRNLLLEVLLGLLAVFADLLLVVLVHLVPGLGLCALSSRLGSSSRVRASGLSVALLLREFGSVVGIRVALAVRVSGLSGITSDLLHIILGEWDSRLDLALDVILGEVWGLVPSVVLCRSIDLLELLLIRVDGRGSVLSSIACDVAEEGNGVADCELLAESTSNNELDPLTQLAELAVGNDQLTESSEALDSLVAVLLGGLLVNGSAWSLGVARADALSLPDEVLEDIAVVLGQEEDLGLFNDIAEILHKLLAISRKLG